MIGRFDLPSKRENHSQFVEDWTLDELTELGFCSLESLLAHPTIQESVHERGKVLVVESKRPSLKHKRSGGLLNKKKHDAHMGKTMKLAESLLDQYEIPKRSTVHYAFHKSMKMQYALEGLNEIGQRCCRPSSFCRS